MCLVSPKVATLPGEGMVLAPLVHCQSTLEVGGKGMTGDHRSITAPHQELLDLKIVARQ